MKKLLSFVFVTMWLVSCGSDGGKKAGESCESGSECESSTCVNGLCAGDNNENNEGRTFFCGENGDAICQPGQYCLVSQTDSVQTAAECFDVPDCGQGTCDCAGEDAPNNSSTCEGALQTSICNNDETTITCNRSGIGL